MRRAALVPILVLCTACAGKAKLSDTSGIGPRPVLPEPDRALVPTVNVVKAKGWAPGQTPVAEGRRVAAFAQGLEHPRWLYVLPNGDVLVAETNAPVRPDDNKGIKGWFFKKEQKKAGGAVPSANRITLLRDADGDGVAEIKTALLTGLNSPFGIAVIGDALYIANADAVMRCPYKTGATSISEAGVKIADLPGGSINHHWTKNIVATPDGRSLVASVGS